MKTSCAFAAAVEPLLKAREAVEKQIADLDRKVMQLARNDVQVRRFMTATGIGPITALCYLAIIDDPTRFKRSRSVGAYVGLPSAIKVFLRTSHPTMPNFILSPDEIDSVTAYILSLARK